MYSNFSLSKFIRRSYNTCEKLKGVIMKKNFQEFLRLLNENKNNVFCYTSSFSKISQLPHSLIISFNSFYSIFVLENGLK